MTPGTRAEQIPPLSRLIYEPIVRGALAEDLGRAGDTTTDALIATDQRGTARIVARAVGRVAGLEIACAAFSLVDSDVTIRLHSSDGAEVRAGEQLAEITGRARSLLTAERTALNLLAHLSGVATATAQLSHAITGSAARVVCTRKTTPGLRALEKYAVRAGGGANHRSGLDDGILIKENHLAALASRTGSSQDPRRLIDAPAATVSRDAPDSIAAMAAIANALRRARRNCGHMAKIEIEVETVEQLRRVLELADDRETRADAVLLDNMAPAMLRRSVDLARESRPDLILEASGGIGPHNIVEIAAAGVDLISTGWITHSAPVLDVSMELETGDV